MITETLQTQLQAQFDMGQIIQTTQLTGGDWNDVYRLKTTRGHLIARVRHPTTELAQVKYEHALMQAINAHITEVPSPYVARNGESFLLHEGRIVAVFPYLPGRPIDRDSPAEGRAAGQMLGRLHQVTLTALPPMPPAVIPPFGQFDWANNHLWAWENIKTLLTQGADQCLYPADEPNALENVQTIFDQRDRIEWARAVHADWLAQVAEAERSLCSAPIHGDFYRRNVLIDQGQISAVIDWDDCRPDWLVFELGRSGWEFAKDSVTHTLDSSRLMAFLKGYYEVGGPVPADELDLLVPFMKCVRIAEILFDLGQAAIGEPWSPAYTLHNLKALEKLTDLDPLRLTFD